MPKRWTHIILPATFAVLGILLLLSGNTEAKIIEVDSNGSGDHITIQDGVNASVDGDVVVVHEGEYHESVDITTSVTITGAEGETVVLTGSTFFYSFNITADGVNITNIIFRDSFYGVLLSECTGAIISDCEFNDCANGISFMASSGNEISNTTFSNNTFTGIMLSDYGFDGSIQGSCDDNRILHNLFNGNKKGIAINSQGVGNLIHGNRFENNTQFGIYCSKKHGTSIDATDNWWGSPFGPYNYDENLFGRGDSIIGPVKIYPWIGIEDIPPSKKLSNAFVLGSVIGSGNGSKEKPFDSIMQAIYHIRPNGTIHVWEGIYFEHLIITKRMKIIGNSSGETTIVSGVFGECVRITANSVEIESMNISVSPNTHQSLEQFGYYSGHYSCMWIESSRNTITDCVFTGGISGIVLSRASNNTISSNTLHPNSNPNHGDGVHLEKVSNDNFIFENTVLGYRECGISVSSSDDNRIERNICTDNEIGISLSGSNGTFLDGNDCTENSEIGIRIRNSSHTVVSHNTCNFNGDVGIELDQGSEEDECVLNELTSNECSGNALAGIDLGDSSQSKLKMNSMQGSGIIIGSIPLKVFEEHDIDDSNTVNGKPVFYLAHQEGVRLNGGAGQVILVNCSNIVIEDQQLDSCSIGITLYYCRSITISNSSFTDNIFGILMHNSTNNLVSNNTLANNNRDFLSGALAAFFSHNSTIAYNTISGNDLVGLGFVLSSNNSISNNTITGNGNGIMFFLDREFFEYFGVDTGEDNTTYGVNRVHYNSIFGNSENGIINHILRTPDTDDAKDAEYPFRVDARYNWWGNDEGPTGKGNLVADHVDFSPWITEDGGLRSAESNDDDDRFFDVLHPMDLLFLLLVSLSILFTALILVVRSPEKRYRK